MSEKKEFILGVSIQQMLIEVWSRPNFNEVVMEYNNSLVEEAHREKTEGKIGEERYTASSEIYDDLAEFTILGHRNLLEKDEDIVQLIPYVAIRDTNKPDNHYFVYQREKGVGEERLLGKTSIGFGGHVEVSDCFRYKVTIGNDDGTLDESGPTIAINNGEDLRQVLMNAAQRELDEEVYHNINMEARECGEIKHIIYSLADKVSAVHLGIIYIVDGRDIVSLEPELKLLGSMTKEEIAQLPNNEEWTKQLLEVLP